MPKFSNYYLLVFFSLKGVGCILLLNIVKLFLKKERGCDIEIVEKGFNLWPPTIWCNMHMSTHTHAWIFTHIHIHTQTHINTQSINSHTGKYIHTCVHMHTHIHIHSHKNTHGNASTYTHKNIYMQIHIYINKLFNVLNISFITSNIAKHWI